MRRTFLTSKTERRSGGDWYIPNFRNRSASVGKLGRIFLPGRREVKRNGKSRKRRLGAFRLAGADAQRMMAVLSKSETANTMLAFLEPSLFGNNAFDFVKRATKLKGNA
jgi:hypothetical protein